MPDQPLTCEQARSLMSHADAAAEVAAHLAQCDECLDELLREGLCRTPAVEIPEGFAARTVARARRDGVGRGFSASFWATAGACLLCPVLAGWAVSSGALGNLLGRIPANVPSPAALAAVAAIEVTLIIGGLWRLSRV